MDGKLMHKHSEKLQYNKSLEVKKSRNAEWEKARTQLMRWNEADQLFEDTLWAS